MVAFGVEVQGAEPAHGGPLAPHVPFMRGFFGSGSQRGWQTSVAAKNSRAALALDFSATNLA